MRKLLLVWGLPTFLLIVVMAINLAVALQPCGLSQASTCNAWPALPVNAIQWWGDDFLPVAWLDTNLGSGFLFFFLDLLLIVLALPWVLNRRARVNWRRTAKNLAHNLLVLQEEFFHHEREAELTIGFLEEIESAVTMMGSAVQAFPGLANALYEVMPIILRVKRRLTILARAQMTAETQRVIREQREKLLMTDVRELESAIGKHRRALRSLSGE